MRWLLFGALLLPACVQSGSSQEKWFLKKNVALPQELIELSGIVVTDTMLFAIQDEAGALYCLDPETYQLIKRIPFGPAGDYEAIAQSGTGFFVVDSRGILYDLFWEQGDCKIKNMYPLHHPEIEYEGLCVANNGQGVFLVGRKTPTVFKNDKRSILYFDLERRTEVVHFEFSESDVWEQYGRQEPEFAGHVEWGSHLELSDLMCDPISGKLWVLSCRPALLIEFTDLGRMVQVHELNPIVLPQAEAVAWLDSGELLIGTEGVLGPARILVYKLPIQKNQFPE